MHNHNIQKYSILIVCLGNICRSPMAEIILQNALKEKYPDNNIKVSSAGFLHDGEPAAQPAEAIMQKWNLNLSCHLSTKLTRKLVSQQDLILTMEEEQAASILEMNEKRPHIESIISYASNGMVKGDVPDPYGYSIDTYESTAMKIKELIDKVVKRLLNVL